MTLTNAIIGQADVGNFRVGVWYDSFDNPLKQLLRAFAAVSYDVTRRTLSLGARTAPSYHRTKTFTDSTITGFFFTVNAPANILTLLGTYKAEYGTFLTADPVTVGDQIKANSVYFEVVGVSQHWNGDSFLYRSLHLRELPYYRET